MNDVARLAGVSPATVSRTLSGSRRVDPELQSRVKAAAKQLGYRVNLIGRTLRRQQSSVIGLIIPDLENPFFASVAHKLSEAFIPFDTDLLVFNAASSLDAEFRGVQSFLGRQVDALIMTPVDEMASRAAVELAAASVPTVQFDRRVERTDTMFVGCNNQEGLELVARHVHDHVDLNRYPPVYIGATISTSTASERLDGFRLQFGTDQPELLGAFDAATGEAGVEQLLDGGWTSATVVTAADVIALGVVHRLSIAGYRIPEDFKIISFDGLAISQMANPTLTTVRQPMEAMARTTQSVLYEAFEGDGADRRADRLLTPTLMVGQSCPSSSIRSAPAGRPLPPARPAAAH
ncbi:MAG: LacI family DNA-binding transcriptional regulator [Acidimicrobiales bacterium]